MTPSKQPEQHIGPREVDDRRVARYRDDLLRCSDVSRSTHGDPRNDATAPSQMVGATSCHYNDADEPGNGDLCGGHSWSHSRILSHRRPKSSVTRSPRRLTSATNGSPPSIA